MESLDSVVFQLTRKCNLVCRHCFFNAGPNKEGKLTLNQTSKALIDLRNFGFNKINKFILTGGEPTLWPDLFGLINNIRRYFPESKIRIDTNGINFLTNPKLFELVKADIYDISVDDFHNQAVISSELRNKKVFVREDGDSELVNLFIKNKVKYKFDLSIRWTSDRRDDHLFNKFFKKYNKQVKLEKKLVTATGRGKYLSQKSINSGYLIKEKPENFSCLMGQSLILAINGCWYGCYHPVGLTKLGKTGNSELFNNFSKLTKSYLYKKLPSRGLLYVLKYLKRKYPKHRKTIEDILAKKYWYRCQPCEDLCRAKIFKI